MISLEPLFDNAFVAVARAGYTTRSSKLPISFLEHERLIVREATSSGRIAVEEFLAKHGIKPTVCMSLASDEAIKNAVRAGAGIAILPLVTVLQEIRWRELEVLPIDEFPLIRKWQLAMRKGKKLSASADALRRLLIRELPELGRVLVSQMAGTEPKSKPTGQREAKRRRLKDH
jgi:DNA-binding transcriptional LysR family regulator